MLHIKQTTSEDLQYSTGNYTQYSVITYKGKQSEKIVYIWMLLNCGVGEDS